MPLQAIYALEHVHLWIEGANTQGKIESSGLADKIKELRDKFDGKR